MLLRWPLVVPALEKLAVQVGNGLVALSEFPRGALEYLYRRAFSGEDPADVMTAVLDISPIATDALSGYQRWSTPVMSQFKVIHLRFQSWRQPLMEELEDLWILVCSSLRATPCMCSCLKCRPLSTATPSEPLTEITSDGVAGLEPIVSCFVARTAAAPLVSRCLGALIALPSIPNCSFVTSLGGVLDQNIYSTVICHQVNSSTTNAFGLALEMQRQYPETCIYRLRSSGAAVPGLGSTLLVRAREDKPAEYVAALVAQRAAGACSHKDDEWDRMRWFRACLDELVKQMTTWAPDATPAVVSFPNGR